MVKVNDGRRTTCNHESALKIIVIFWWKIVLYAKNARKRKKSDSVLSKAPTATEKYKKQRDNTKTPPKLRLHNDCGPT